jgi:hypothetical protein
LAGAETLIVTLPSATVVMAARSMRPDRSTAAAVRFEAARPSGGGDEIAYALT